MIVHSSVSLPPGGETINSVLPFVFERTPSMHSLHLSSDTG